MAQKREQIVVITIKGPVGVGKSTVGRALRSLIKGYGGSVEINDELAGDIGNLPPPEWLRMVMAGVTWRLEESVETFYRSGEEVLSAADYERRLRSKLYDLGESLAHKAEGWVREEIEHAEAWIAGTVARQADPELARPPRPSWFLDFHARAQDILLLVDVGVTIEELKARTMDEVDEAVDWAGALHLYASDNDDVEVPPKPDWLPERKASELGLYMKGPMEGDEDGESEHLWD